jgi:regulator of PEP synthase PpsR (kinase-PPPase family)
MEWQKRIVWIVSDGTGRTAREVLRAASYQFENADLQYRLIGNVTTETGVIELMDRIKEEPGMVVFTIVSHDLRRTLHRLCVENHMLAVDLFGPLVTTLQKYLQKLPLESPGLSYTKNRNYFRMVDAIDFTIRHDDGTGLESAEQADIILLGPSRVGKTPLAVYLGYLGWKVSNIPVVRGSELPDICERVPHKVFCLVIDPVLLRRRRVDRIRKLGDPHISGYTDLESINEELAYCRRIAAHGKKWPVLDMSYRTVEDVAREIMIPAALRDRQLSLPGCTS